jgi:hypothetical protein
MAAQRFLAFLGLALAATLLAPSVVLLGNHHGAERLPAHSHLVFSDLFDATDHAHPYQTTHAHHDHAPSSSLPPAAATYSGPDATTGAALSVLLPVAPAWEVHGVRGVTGMPIPLSPGVTPSGVDAPSESPPPRMPSL